MATTAATLRSLTTQAGGGAVVDVRGDADAVLDLPLDLPLDFAVRLGEVCAEVLAELLGGARSRRRRALPAAALLAVGADRVHGQHD